MKRIFGYLLAVILLPGIFLCCSGSAKVIPLSKLKKIYSEMLLADQWISKDWRQTRIADTSLVYSQILEKYGYDKEDYVKSVSHYMEDPDRFSRLFDEINKDFAGRIKEIDEEIKVNNCRDSLKRVLLGRNFRRPEIFPGRLELPYYDSIIFSLDSLGIYASKPVAPDTLFHGPEILLKEPEDSTAATDSLKPKIVSVR